MKRKILYSPGYGAGWTSWNGGDVAKFMLTYQPIIDAIDRGEKMGCEHPAVKQLVEDCKDKFDAGYVCILGADDLRVAEVCGLVRIEEYDGSESFVVQGEDEGWM